MNSVLYNLDLDTQRLHIRKLTHDDVGAWMEYFNSEKALKFMGKKAGDREACKTWIERQMERYTECDYDGLRALINIDTGEMTGQCGLLIQQVDGITELEIGYHLIPRFWKKGFATEAVKTFKEFAFNNEIADSLISIIHVENHNSQQVAERNGLKREKKTIFKEFPVFIYRIQKSDWLKSF